VRKYSPIDLVGLLLFGGLLVGTFLSPTLLLGCKFFVDSISYGYSGAKTQLLLLFIVGLVVLSPIPSPWKPRWNNRYLWALGLLHAWAVANQAIYAHTFQASLWQRTVLIADGTYSSTGLSHIHAAKIPIAFLSGYGGHGFDAGSPFLAAFPWWWMALHSALFLGVAVASFLVVHERQKGWRWGQTLSLALGVFIVTKNGIDGGPFSPSTLVALPFLGGMLFQRRGLWAGCLLAAAGCLPGVCDEGLLFIAKLPREVGPAVALISLPVLLERLALHRTKADGVALLLSLTVLLSVPYWRYVTYEFYRGPSHTLGTLRFGLTKVRAGQTVNALSSSDLTGKASDLVQVSHSLSAGRLSVYRLKALRDTNLMELSRRLKIPLFRAALNVSAAPAFVEVVGPFTLPSVEQWLTSPAVLAYSFHTSPRGSRLVLEMVPGARTDLAAAVLPAAPLVCQEIRLLKQRPAVESPWLPGPGSSLSPEVP
jgi:hypothetical protein